MAGRQKPNTRKRQNYSLVQLDDEDVSAAVGTDGAGRGSRLGAELTHPVGREDEELPILRNSANRVLGAKYL